MAYDANSLLVIEAAPFCRSLAALPAMRALRVAYPRAFIVVAASRATCEVLGPIGIANELVDLGVIRSGEGGGVDALKRFMKLMGQTRNREFQLVLDLSPGVDTALASRLGKLGNRLVTPSRVFQVLESLFGRWSGGARFKNHGDECASVLSQIELTVNDSRSPLILPPEENRRFEELLARHGSRGGEPIVVLFGSGSSPRTATLTPCFADVAARLVRDFGARIIAVDEPLVRGFSDRITLSIPANSVKVASPRALELAAAVARASLVITNEGDLANLTEVFGTPMIEIAHRAPSGASNHRVLTYNQGADFADDLFSAACELIQTARFSTLFQR